MTDEQINIAVAEACGWKRIEPPKDQGWGAAARGKEWWYVYQLPKYSSDLNAMHEAEKHIPEKHHRTYYYEEKLHLMTIGRGERATARQRAEAFLKTLGKWPNDL